MSQSPKVQRLGILGGGQLGRFLALDARRYGLQVSTLDPAPDGPCTAVADDAVVAAYDDLDAVLDFAQRCDVLTFEFENIPQATVAAIEAAGHRIAPSSHVLAITQDRLVEKRFVQSCGLATAPFAAVSSLDDLDRALEQTGLPAILKTRRGGYDGKGQWRIANRAELVAAITDAQAVFAQGGFILEGQVRFERELSILGVRDAQGASVTFPIVENEHRDGILAKTIAPAMLHLDLEQQMLEIARRIGDGLGYVGCFAVEAFVVGTNILVNEIAPRVHNSGHYTLEATSISQFDAHLRAILGFPLTQPRLLSPAVMLNVLGSGTGNHLTGIDTLLALPETTLHLYGKHHAAARRKMAHVTLLGRTHEELAPRVAIAEHALHWVPSLASHR